MIPACAQFLPTRRDPRPPIREYDRVSIWKDGDVVSSGGLPRIFVYPSGMKRILYRPFRTDRETGDMTYSCTFYWNNGAWSSVQFPGKVEMSRFLDSTAAVLLRWPVAESI